MPSASEIRDGLGLPDSAAHWYDSWEAVGAPEAPVPVPGADEIARLLVEWCDADPEDAREVAAARPDPRADPQLWWVLERCYRQLVSDLGGTTYLAWPQLPDKWGAAGRFTYLHAMLAAFPQALEYHRNRGVAPELSKAIFADVGEKLRLNRAIFGRLGLDVSLWFTLHFRGAIYRLGRLQFNIEPLRVAIPALDAAKGDWSLGVHIPGSGGPMSPPACLESVKWARRFFPEKFGDIFTGTPVMSCTSWMLDPQLREFLPPESNIVAFQDLFTLVPSDGEPADAEKDILRFVFQHVGDYKSAALPRDSTLRRHLADGLAAGRRWQVRTGYVTA